VAETRRTGDRATDTCRPARPGYGRTALARPPTVDIIRRSPTRPGWVIRAPTLDRCAAGPNRGGTVSDVGGEQGAEVDEAPGVEEWIADESQAQDVADGTAPEDERRTASLGDPAVPDTAPERHARDCRAVREHLRCASRSRGAEEPHSEECRRGRSHRATSKGRTVAIGRRRQHLRTGGVCVFERSGGALGAARTVARCRGRNRGGRVSPEPFGRRGLLRQARLWRRLCDGRPRSLPFAAVRRRTRGRSGPCPRGADRSSKIHEIVGTSSRLGARKLRLVAWCSTQRPGM
jgi:hypothetical protein